MFPGDFNKIGSPETVRLDLDRLNKSGFIVRIAKGIYVCPKPSKHLELIFNSVKGVIKVIDKRDKIRMIPTGTYVLDLKTEIPTKLIFLTDGSSL